MIRGVSFLPAAVHSTVGGDTDHERRFNLSRPQELGMLVIQLDAELGVDVELVGP
jgi:hypothetical protein